MSRTRHAQVMLSLALRLKAKLYTTKTYHGTLKKITIKVFRKLVTLLFEVIMIKQQQEQIQELWSKQIKTFLK